MLIVIIIIHHFIMMNDNCDDYVIQTLLNLKLQSSQSHIVTFLQ